MTDLPPETRAQAALEAGRAYYCASAELIATPRWFPPSEWERFLRMVDAAAPLLRADLAREVEALRQERDEAQKAHKLTSETLAEVLRRSAHNAERADVAEAQLAAARGIIERFAEHRAPCTGMKRGVPFCDCGLDAALSEGRPV